MKLKQLVSVGGGIAVAALLGSMMTSGAALANNAPRQDEVAPGIPESLTSEQMEGHEGAEWYAVSPSGEVLGSEDASLWAQESTESPGEASPRLIDDPVAWSACFAVFDEDYPLTKLQWYTATGPMLIELQCGYHNSATGAGHGWHHIAAQHEQEWRNRIIQVGGSVNGDGWDDLMAYSIQYNMNAPAVNVSHGSGKICIGAPVMMFDNQGEYSYTFYPSHIFTTDSKRVITSIPGSSYTC